MGNSHLRILAFREQSVRHFSGHKVKHDFDSLLVRGTQILPEETFHSMLTLEYRRAEHSRRPFVLMLLDASGFVEAEAADPFMSRVASVLLNCTRETDLVGWHNEGVMLGVIFTEISLHFKSPITELLHSKIATVLRDELSREVTSNLVVTVHLFPEGRDQRADKVVADSRIHLDHSNEDQSVFS